MSASSPSEILKQPGSLPLDIQRTLKDTQEARKEANKIELHRYIVTQHADYLCSVPCTTFTRRAAHVVGFTCVGAAVGCAAGATVGGIGAGPGAGIGAAVGLTIGIATVSIRDIVDGYGDWKSSQKKKS